MLDDLKEQDSVVMRLLSVDEAGEVVNHGVPFTVQPQRLKIL